MKAYRTEIERLTPALRQYARALVESYRADVADELVHDVLAEAMRGDQGWTSEELASRLYARLIGANRHRLRTEIGERRSLPGRGTGVDPKPARPGFRGGEPAANDAGIGLGLLSLADREALLLVVLARIDYPQAAAILGIPTGTLITRLAHARDHLGAALWSGSPSQPALPQGAGPNASRGRHLRLVKP